MAKPGLIDVEGLEAFIRQVVAEQLSGIAKSAMNGGKPGRKRGRKPGRPKGSGKRGRPKGSGKRGRPKGSGKRGRPKGSGKRGPGRPRKADVEAAVKAAASKLKVKKSK